MSGNRREDEVNHPVEVAKEMVDHAKLAAAVFRQYDQEHTDAIVKACFEAGFNNRVMLAKMAHEETGIGKWKDKVLKNVIASKIIYDDIKNEKTVGVISEDEVTGITEIAQPVGPIYAVIPVTNPTSTVIFKVLIALKSRNPIIISPARKAAKCSVATAKLLYEAALAAGAPEDCIQWIEEPSREITKELMAHKDIALILATGGAGLVNSAYSSGTPAFGVGAGNVPVFIEKTADIEYAVQSILASKTFDNGTVCASEQSIVFEKSISKEVMDTFEKHKAYHLTGDQIEAVASVVINKDKGTMNPDILGKSAQFIAKMAGIEVPEDTSVLFALIEKVGEESPLSAEILAPVLAFFCVDSLEGGIKRCIDLNYYGGVGHTVSMFSNDEEAIRSFSLLMNAGRIVINSPSSQGGIGGMVNMLRPSLTLGCGTGGKNITTDNITAKHLLNIQRVARVRVNQLFARFDKSIYFDESLTIDDIVKDYYKNQ